MVDKWISPGGGGGKGKSMRFHTMPEKCSYYKNMKKPRTASDNYLQWHEAEECEECSKERRLEGIEISGYTGAE